MTDETRIDLQWVIAALRRRFWLVAGCTGLFIVATLLITSRMPLTYKTTVTLLISSNEATGQNEYSELVAGEKLTFTFSEMLTSTSVLEAAIEKLNLDISPGDLADNVAAEPVKNTQLITLSVIGKSPEEAANIANAIAEEFRKQVKKQLSERYAAFLLGKQAEMDAAQVLIDQLQPQIDELNKKDIASQTKLASLQNDLSDLRNDYRANQKSYQELQLTTALLKERIKIIEKAQTPTVISNQGSVLLMFDFPTTQTNQSGTGAAVEPLTLTYGSLVKGQPVLQKVIDRLALSDTVEDLAGRIVVTPIPNTRLMKISVTGADATQVVELANTISDIYITYIQEIQTKPYLDQMAILQASATQLSGQISDTEQEIEAITATQIQAKTELARLEKLQTGYQDQFRARQQEFEQLSLTVRSSEDSVSVVSPASLPTKPLQNRPFYLVLATIIGVLLSMGLILILEQSNKVLRNAEDVTTLSNVNVLGKIGQIPKGGNKLILVSNPHSVSAEAIRTIATNIRLLPGDRPARTLIVTSPSSGEGKTLMAANLAIALAEAGSKVVLVDADLIVPQQQEYFEIRQAQGLSNALATGYLNGHLQTTTVDRLHILPGGETPSNTNELFNSANLPKILSELNEKADYILLDCPPIVPVAYSRVLASVADGVILVVRLGKTPRKSLEDAVENLKLVNAQVLGVVLNDPNHKPGAYERYDHSRRSRGFVGFVRRLIQTTMASRKSPEGDRKEA